MTYLIALIYVFLCKLTSISVSDAALNLKA